MSLNNNDFDEDVDDILLSDDEALKKPKKASNFLKEDNNVPNGKITSKEIETSSSNPKKTYKSTLFDGDQDPLAMIDNLKPQSKISQVSTKKGAKSVLDSLLNPASELDDFSFNKSPSKSNETNNIVQSSESINDKKPTIDDDFWKASKYKPSTTVPQVKNTNENSTSKRTVRFSTDANLDAVVDLNDSLSGRPVTAPSTSTELSKSRFISRFEEAEFDNVLSKESEIKSNSESDPSMWKTTTSDDFHGSLKFENKVEKYVDDNELKTNGNIRTNPKQKLTDFLQTSSEDIFARSTSKAQYSGLDQSSNEDVAYTGKATMLDEPYSGRRASVLGENVFERPKTGHGRSDNLAEDARRRNSVQMVSSYDRPRTAQGRVDTFQNKEMSSRSDLSDIELQLKQVKMEKDDLQYKLEGITKRSKEEIEILEKSHKNRMELLEDNMQRREKRFKEEIEILSQQNKQRLQMLEDERMEIRSELSRRQDDIENQKRTEIQRLKEEHKFELEKMKRSHEDLIEKCRHAKSEEESTIRLAQPTTAHLQTVLTQVSNGAHDLASLKQQLLDQMNSQIKDKDTELRMKNDSLRQLEEQLNVQKDENCKERERLQCLVSQLDIQLKEQAKQADEERWYMRQEQNKLAALQSSLDKEREHLLKEKDQNRVANEEFRKKLLEEQKELFDKIYDEKRSLSDERAKLTREIAKWSESSQFTNIKKNQECAEIEGIRSAIAEERREIDLMRSNITKEREENLQKLSQLNTLNYEVKLKFEKLSQLEMELSTKQSVIEEKEKNCNNLSLIGESALKKARTIQDSHQDQLVNIQRQLLILAEKEKKIHSEEIELGKLRSTVVNKDKTFTCSKCSNILRDSAIGGSLNTINMPSLEGFQRSRKHQLDNFLDQDIANSIEYSHNMAAKIEEDRLIKSIRRAADEDRDYLENERAYLRSLTKSPDPFIRNQIRS